MVPVADLEAELCALEQEFAATWWQRLWHGDASAPIVTYVDQTRVIISFPHFRDS